MIRAPRGEDDARITADVGSWCCAHEADRRRPHALRRRGGSESDPFVATAV